MKYSQLDENERRTKLRVIDEHWDIYSKWRGESLGIITKHLFILNSGGLLASISYIAAKEEVNGVDTLIWLFFAGTMCSVLRSAIDYYMSEAKLSSLRNTMIEFYEDKIDFQKCVERVNEEYKLMNFFLHNLGWLSAILFVTAISIGACTIKAKAEQGVGGNACGAPLLGIGAGCGSTKTEL